MLPVSVEGSSYHSFFSFCEVRRKWSSLIQRLASTSANVNVTWKRGISRIFAFLLIGNIAQQGNSPCPASLSARTLSANIGLLLEKLMAAINGRRLLCRARNSWNSLWTVHPALTFRWCSEVYFYDKAGPSLANEKVLFRFYTLYFRQLDRSFSEVRPLKVKEILILPEREATRTFAKGMLALGSALEYVSVFET